MEAAQPTEWSHHPVHRVHEGGQRGGAEQPEGAAQSAHSRGIRIGQDAQIRLLGDREHEHRRGRGFEDRCIGAQRSRYCTLPSPPLPILFDASTRFLGKTVSVPAKIASFDDKFTATYKEDVKLPCLAVGVPAPEVTWKVRGAVLQSSDRLRQLPEGSLFIKEVDRTDAGEYSCYVENTFGHDTVTHQLIVHGENLERRRKDEKEEIQVRTNEFRTIRFRSSPSLAPNHPYRDHHQLVDDEGAPSPHRQRPDPRIHDPLQTGIRRLGHGADQLHGAEVHFGESVVRLEIPDLRNRVQRVNKKWSSRLLVIVLERRETLTIFRIGTGDPSDMLNTRTKGSKPIIPEAARFIEVATNSITLHLNAWSDGGCPMIYFVVEHKKK